MRVRVVEPTRIDEAVITEAAAIIRDGGLVAFPTETVYGLGADATNAEAVARIFAAKGRPTYNPLIVHVSDIDAVRSVVGEWPDSARSLATRFWPGPLTLVLGKRSTIPDIVTAGLATVAVRVPDHPVALALLRAAGRAIAAPSANASNAVSPTEGRHVATSLGASPDMILDAGPVTIGIESTVLDLTSSIPTILRPGMISRGQLAAVIGDVRLAGERRGEVEPRRSPGMLDRHYSPRARLVLTEPGSSALVEAIAREAANEHRVAVLARSEFSSQAASVIRMPESPHDYARLLYTTLHLVDDDGFAAVIVESVPMDDEWDGVRDRLSRAATASSS